MKFTSKTWLAIMAGALFASPAAIASDHTDGSAVQVDEAADITDLFTWMSDDSTLTLIMDVNKEASTTTLFSPAVAYTFHITAHGPPAPGGVPTLPVLLGGTSDPEVDVICTFTGATAPQTVSCWTTATSATAGTAPTTLDYVTGTASMTTPLVDDPNNTLMTVYSGLAADPFFFNLEGFEETAGTVDAAKGSLTFNPSGCPVVAGATLTLLDGQLTTTDGGTPVDAFAGLNVNAIVVQLDLSLVLNNSQTDGSGNATDTLVSVWASTNNF
jgi:hypothetical protein